MFVSLQFLIIIIYFKNYYFYLFIHLSSNSFVLIINELTALIEFEDTKIEQLLLSGVFTPFKKKKKRFKN